MSKGEDSLYQLLKSEFPKQPIKRQHPIKVKRTTLYLDLYLNRMGLAFEVDGIQHEKQNSFFHKTRYDFQDSKHRDSLKEQWCRENGVTLIRIKDREVNINNLRNAIQNKINRNN